ncbi:MAG: hypothetical protein IMZ61_14105 [Planctomycetes bacterium]|nr:hypothetical protein [Chloroflexota bacterium]MBE3145032.1 hypothetical protein [Planctomycetota bacterium]
MMIDPQLRQRILRSLRWLVRDCQYRFDDCKEQLQDEERGGYSDELKEAILLLQDLEQGEMCLNSPIEARVYTEDECKDVGNLIGMTLRECIDCFCYYQSQGWRKGNGLPIVDLSATMRQWHLRKQDEVVQGKGQSAADQVAQLKAEGKL